MLSRRIPTVTGLALALAIVSFFSVSTSFADPVFGFTEDWSGTDTDGWAGGAFGAVLDNPGTGGVDGDGYLRSSQTLNGNYGTRSTGPEYFGNWINAGIELIKFSLNDVGAADVFEIHLCIGNQGNFWQYNTGFVPPNGSWQEFTVDITDETKFTQIIGTGTFTQALQSADRLLFRHDLPPFTMGPDPTHGDLGIDHLFLTALNTPAKTTTWGAIKRLYR